jgi:hypothetical protein
MREEGYLTQHDSSLTTDNFLGSATGLLDYESDLVLQVRVRSTSPKARMDLVSSFRGVLATKGLSVNSLSKAAERLYGASSPYCIPHDFCYRNIPPNICQLVALSRITGYCLVDLLSLFGFPPDEILKRQIKLHTRKTVLLPSTLYDRKTKLPFLGAHLSSREFETTEPFASRVTREPLTSAGDVAFQDSRRFLYAKIGEEDALAFPELVPGSIVRIDTQKTRIEPNTSQQPHRRPIYLVQHPGGLTCSHAEKIGSDRILLVPHTLPFGCPEFRLNREAVVLGTVDAELHPLQGLHIPDHTAFRRSRIVRDPAIINDRSLSPGEILRLHRESRGLSLRQASEMSARIAQDLDENEYLLSPASLYKLETSGIFPRRIAKLFSICTIYCVDLWTLLSLFEIAWQDTGQESLPQYFFPEPQRRRESKEQSTQHNERNTLGSYLNQVLDEVPVFLASAWPYLLPGGDVSAGEIFWFGKSENPLHPLLKGALLLVVDAQYKGNSEGQSRWTELWQRPLMLLLTRSGKYVCGFCSVDRGNVTVEPHPECAAPAFRYRNGIDAEMIGQVTGIVRLLT